MLSTNIASSLGMCHPTRVSRPDWLSHPPLPVYPSQGRQGRTNRHDPSCGTSQSPVVPCAGAAATVPPTSARHVPPAPSEAAAPDLGYPRTFASSYTFEGREPLGRGGNGVVRLVRETATGTLFACKSIPKALPAAANISERKRQQHLDSIRREVEVLQRLRRCLNVVELQGVFEDADCVHLVMTHCSGGELWRSGRHYSERTVASYMRAVLRTVAQCHAHHILHRDIKPGNFLFLDSSVRSPLLAIDFGMAMPYSPDELPRTDLGLEGTPWFMAPEALAARVGPPCDVWAAGVTAYQMLTGRVPFNDRRHPSAPAVSMVWRSILTDEPDFSGPFWRDVSPEARQFVASLLHKDPSRRPTAREALQHPWLHGKSDQRATGRSMGASVVQRLQRWGQASRFKQNVLQSMANDLLAASETAGCTIDWAYEEAPAVPADAVNTTQHGSDNISASTGCNSSSNRDVCALMSTSGAQAVQELHRLSGATAGGEVSRQGLADAIRALGLRLDESEIQRLVGQLAPPGGAGHVDRALLVASQLDWRDSQANDMALQPIHEDAPADSSVDALITLGGTSGVPRLALAGHAGQLRQREDLWRTLAHQTFAALDLDGDGVLQPADLARAVRGFGNQSVAATVGEVSPLLLKQTAGAALLDAIDALAPAPADADVAVAATAVVAALAAPTAVAGAGDAASGLLLQPRSSSAGVGDHAVPHDDASGGATGQGVDFEEFLAMLKTRSYDSLDLYDGRSTSSEDDSSTHSRSTASNDSTHNGRLSIALNALQQARSSPASMAAAAAVAAQTGGIGGGATGGGPGGGERGSGAQSGDLTAPAATSGSLAMSGSLVSSGATKGNGNAAITGGAAAPSAPPSSSQSAATPVWRFGGGGGGGGGAGSVAGDGKTPVGETKVTGGLEAGLKNENGTGQGGGAMRGRGADASVRGSRLYTNAAIAGSRAGSKQQH